LDRLLTPENADNFTNELLRNICFTLLFAGHDTTTSLCSWAVYYVVANPQVYERLMQELTENLALGEEVQHHQLSSLEYLRAIMKETLRLKPRYILQRGMKN
jgi:cytochrome P450/NADPH-cytochrome P450 reductase